MKDTWRSYGWRGALIVLLTVVAYFPALRGGFIWDDDDHLTKNPAVHSTEGLKQIWSSLAVSRYYPLTLTTFWTEYHLWGLNPLPYHVVNIALQAINAVLLWILLRRLKVRGAWLAAALWAVHPVNVETVAWVTELKNTQSIFFFLLALLIFLRFEDGQRGRDYGIALVCGAAAMLSKPSTVVLPGVILLCAWWRRGRWTRQDLLRVAPLVALAAGMSLLTVLEQRRHIEREIALGWTLTAGQRLVLAADAVWFYAGKLLWPADLTFIYPRWELRTDSVVAWLPLMGLLAVAWVLWRFRHEKWARAGTFGLGYFVIALLPVLGFFEIFFFRYSYVADHFQYLASIGLVALVVSLGNMICDRAGKGGREAGRVVAAGALLTLVFCTWTQAHVYHDSETLWRDTLAKNPGALMAHNNLGVLLEESGRITEAIEHFQQALRINADNSETHNNLGFALFQQGDRVNAMKEYQQALRFNPGLAIAYFNIGTVFRQLGQPSEAIRQFEQALRLNPNYPEAHNNLGLALQGLGKVAEAQEHYQEALRINPNYVEAHNNLGNIFFSLRRMTEAASEYEAALRIKPDYAEAYNNLGNALLELGRVPEAITQYEQALLRNPDYVEAHYNLGSALYRAGKVSEAIDQFAQAVRLKPKDPQAHYNFGVVLEQSGHPKQAIAQYEEALGIQPDYTQAQNRLTRLQSMQ
jgi:protein O-mannosyl-transferase